jgi:hypothetical protein
MLNHDAGHSHLPNGRRLVTGCPLCDHIKAARNQAIAHLGEALHLLSLIQPADPSGDPRPTIRLNLGPIGVTGDDVNNCHSIDLTAKQAEALSDGIDSMNAYLGSNPNAPTDGLPRDTADAVTDAIPIDPDRMARSTGRFLGWLQGQSGEAIESGEWSAAAVAQNDPDLYADVTDLFLLLDPRTVTKQVLDDAHADNLTVNRALDAFFGEIADPYADEDDA